MPSHRAPTFALSLLLVSTLATASAAAPVLGLVESWPDSGNVELWSGGSTSYTNPGSGGVGGDHDGYLRVTQATRGRLGTRSGSVAYLGSWSAAGITQVQLWLNDVGADDPLEIHFALGQNSNRWLYSVGFDPPHNQWAMYTVDLTNSADWVQTINGSGTGTFQAALDTVEVVNIRYDLAPFVQEPDSAAGDFGVDEISLTSTVGAAARPGPSVSRPVWLHAPSPNPAAAPMAFSFRTYDDGPIRVRVVDVTGRLVRSEELAGDVAGERSWTWDGRDHSGRAVAAGVYRIRVEGRAGGTSRPVVLIR